MIHCDLFSGIGGFSYAVDQIWDDVEHIFCEINPFCQQVLKKHWKGSVIYGDIRKLVADTEPKRCIGGSTESLSKQTRMEPSKQEGKDTRSVNSRYVDILTGGFPCQPFSQAGKRKGTDDDRHLWPQMFRVIQLTKPTWVIAENVRGILTIEGGLVFEQVCLDLEREGYEVQPFIIPACAVNAPHRRDRVWIIAHLSNNGLNRNDTPGSMEGEFSEDKKQSGNRRASGSERCNRDVRNPVNKGLQRREQLQQSTGKGIAPSSSWQQSWLEVATKLCGMDDGLSAELDGFKLTKAGHRVERLKSLGNAIVPQVAIEILRAIKEAGMRG